MTLEVVSSSSVRKDTVDLRDRYYKAGILEYWLVDTPKYVRVAVRHSPPWG